MPQLPPAGASGAFGAAAGVEEGASGTVAVVVEEEAATLGGGGPYETGFGDSAANGGSFPLLAGSLLPLHDGVDPHLIPLIGSAGEVGERITCSLTPGGLPPPPHQGASDPAGSTKRLERLVMFPLLL